MADLVHAVINDMYLSTLKFDCGDFIHFTRYHTPQRNTSVGLDLKKRGVVCNLGTVGHWIYLVAQHWIFCRVVIYIFCEMWMLNL